MGRTQQAWLSMPKKTLPRIASAAANERPPTFRIHWDNGEKARVDVSGLVETFSVYEPLRCSSELFRQVRVGEFGVDVAWTDAIDMPANSLWRLAQEQAYARHSGARTRSRPPKGRLLRARRKANSPRCRPGRARLNFRKVARQRTAPS